jgi:hypothetical protein
MIVSEDTVSKALQYLAEDPHPIATARYDLTIAENLREETFARLYLLTEGTVNERESQVEMDESYQHAKGQEAKAAMQLERHRARTRAAEMLIETWRSENANIRAAERVR